MKTKLALLLLCLLVFDLKGQIQDTTFTYSSELWDSDREIRVCLPQRYQRDTVNSFSTVYVLDSQSDLFWNMAKGNISYLVDQYQVIPSIIVGVVSDNRGYEFNPKNPELTEQFEKEIIPFIENKYRVNDHRVIIGHSWAGAFIGNNLLSDKRDLFSAYIGISPSFDALGGVIFDQADSLLSAGTKFNQFLYASSGDIGYREIESTIGIEKMDSLFKTYPDIAPKLEKEQISNTDHWSCVIPSINNGMLAVSRNCYTDQYTIDQFIHDKTKPLSQHIEEFYSSREREYGFVHRVSKGDYNFFADDYREQGNYEAAIELYELSIDMGNDKVVSHFNLGLCYEELSQQEKANTIFKNCLSLLEEQKEEHSTNFYDSLKEEINSRLNAEK